VKKKHAQVLAKQQSFYEAEVRVSGRQFESRMMAAQHKLMSEKLKLVSTKEKLYIAKSKHRRAMQHQLDETQRTVSIVQNYADSLQDANNDLRDELKEALSEKHRATSLTVKAKQLASHRLEKWHIERERRRAAEDEVACLNKSAMQMNKIIEEYRTVIEQSHKSKRRLMKEWANDEAAAAHGGGRQWPPWVVQIIFELLVNGTTPSAVPTAMQTMYHMLTGENPDELPSVSFVRSCRVVVEVIGETIATIKLADAPTWNQLWTDGTTRWQIPFTALVIGLMGEDEDIDPIVVSSCIFMEDERSETQADGILNRVNTNHCNDCPFFYNNHAQCKPPFCLVQINSLKNRLTRREMSCVYIVLINYILCHPLQGSTLPSLAMEA